jgi:putative ATP-dependent endonuclease of OLD family
MFLSELRIENFRMFGEDEHALTIAFRHGLTALVGENDAGKTTVIDAIRLVLGTRDHEALRIDDADFHLPPTGEPRRSEIRLRCKFEDLTRQDVAAFVEYLTYDSEYGTPALYVNWKASLVHTKVGQRQFRSVEIRSGKDGDGPQIEAEARLFLCVTYLRPLRDAERAMSAGRGSRLSQILLHTKAVSDGDSYNPESETLPENLSLIGIGDYTSDLLARHEGIQQSQKRLNDEYLESLSFPDDLLTGVISVSGTKSEDTVRLRQLLEKLELELKNASAPGEPFGRGLGSNNLLFMACELLLLGSEQDNLPILLIEEPEAHLHPQRQLRLMRFLQKKTSEEGSAGQRIQVIVTTHSPNLASAIDLENLVLMQGRRAYSLAKGCTLLDGSDYGFLERFLDVTKANLFFARGLLIVEGDAENILLPMLARLLGVDLTAYGISIVNVGGVGLRRFARIFQRQDVGTDGSIDVPVACVTDFDVMPDRAPSILGKVRKGEVPPTTSERRWRMKGDFPEEDLKKRRAEIYGKASGQGVETFVSDQWTFEYDLAYHGLAREVWVAAHLAKVDEPLHAGKKPRDDVIAAAVASFEVLHSEVSDHEELAIHVYALFVKDSSVSKAIAAQYLAELLQQEESQTPVQWREKLPPYIVGAIDHVTRKARQPAAEPQVLASI